MPSRSILSAAEHDSLLALPDTKDDLIRYYGFSDADLSIIRQHRGPENRLGFAVQLCYLRFSGTALGVSQSPYSPLARLAADQIIVSAESWEDSVKVSRSGASIWWNCRHGVAWPDSIHRLGCH